MTTVSVTVASTISPTAAAARDWDAIVVGAGPAGSLAAREIARSGATVLLVDKAAFPRTKVCGSCLNGAALATLADVGLGDLPERLGSTPLFLWRLHTRGARAQCRLPAGAALSRESLDAALVAEALSAGAHFVSETKATLESQVESGCRRVRLSHGSQHAVASAKIVLAAGGLAGNSLSQLPEFASVVVPNSRLGAGVILDSQEDSYAAGCIYMASGRGGYVGLVRLEDGRLDVAAALDRQAMRAAGGPGPLAARILVEVKLPVPEGLLAAPWRGTPPLTRRRRVAGERVFVLGDAAGYLEPFTGEGMAWALASAAAVAPLALAGAAKWRPELAAAWIILQRRIVGRKQRVCRLAGAILRRPLLAGLASRMLAIAPWLASPLIGAINRPAKVTERVSLAICGREQSNVS